MERKIYNELKAWKENPHRKPLILMGARQVGKTWIMRHFGEREYESVAYVNCDEEPRMREVFLPDYNIDRILLAIQAITGVSISAGRTLIILDEIQAVARGLHSLKYFCENAPGQHVMVAGSLLGITLTQGESFPVGKVDMLHMGPLDFGEFLGAMGQTAWADILRGRDWELIGAMHTKFVEFLRMYYFVGGMPEVVKSFVEDRDLASVRQIQRAILDAYRNDISKHTTKRESVRIGQVLQSLPAQLARENKKFIYGAIKHGARAADFELAIQWLVDAGIVRRVARISKPAMPLKFYEDFDAFKLFLLDCGLLACMVDAPADQMLVQGNVFVEFKGALTEQFVLQQLVAAGVEPFYWSNSRTPAEIDFVIQSADRVIPIEVKAEENVRAKSLAQFVKDNPGLKGLRLSMCGYADQGWMENLPLYAVGSLEG